MIRLAGAAAIVAAGVVVFLGMRPRSAAAGGWVMPNEQGDGDPLPLPPPEAPPVPADLVPGARLTPSQAIAVARQIDPERWMPIPELLAFIQVESAFLPTAYRFEPRLGEASWGLMQVLESTARENGLGSNAPETMFRPEVSIAIGINYARAAWELLTRRLGREPYEHEWVGSYNAGVGGVLRGNVPQSYVARWRAARDNFAGLG